MIDVEKACSFSFEDPEWVSKLGIGALVSLFPILNITWSGYLVDLIRNVMQQAEEPLPRWEDSGKKFQEGLILFGASVIYAVPILAAVFLPLGTLVFSNLSSGEDILQESIQAILGTQGILLFALYCAMLVYGLTLSAIYPAILVMFAREGTFASCFKIRQGVGMIRNQPAAFLQAWGVSLAAGLSVSVLLSFINLVVGWIPCLGWILGGTLSLGSSVYVSVVRAHLFGQFGVLYRRAGL